MYVSGEQYELTYSFSDEGLVVVCKACRKCHVDEGDLRKWLDKHYREHHPERNEEAL